MTDSEFLTAYFAEFERALARRKEQRAAAFDKVLTWLEEEAQQEREKTERKLALEAARVAVEEAKKAEANEVKKAANHDAFYDRGRYLLPDFFADEGPPRSEPWENLPKGWTAHDSWDDGWTYRNSKTGERTPFKPRK